MEQVLEPRTVRLAIPAKAEYVGLARLAVAGVCRLTPLSPDGVVDLKLAIDEAANSWIGPPAEPGDPEPVHDLSFRFALEVARLLLDISCPGPQHGSDEERELSRAILEATVDECYLEVGSVRLVKYLANSAQ